MKKFKYLNPEVVEIVEKLGQQAPNVNNMKDEDLQKTAEAIDNTINGIRTELNSTRDALSEVVKAVHGEIARRGIAKRVENQISMFDLVPAIENKKEGK